MMKIDTNEIELYMELQRRELRFRMQLYKLQEMSEERLKVATEIKLEAEALRLFKDRCNNIVPQDRELHKSMMKILNDKFNGRI